MDRLIHRLVLSFVAIAVACAAPACSATTDDGDGAATALSEPGRDDLPWEVRSASGETYLANVFYADASENEQIMPLTIGGRHQIDRLVYPTIGNPNLYVKSDPQDSFMTVARVETDLVAHLAPKLDRTVGSSNFLRHFDIASDANNGIRFFLVARASRESATEANGIVNARPGVFEVQPSAMYAHAITPDVPEAFKSRYTVRFMFDRASMAAIPEGLYDVRMEIRKNGAIATSAAGVNKDAYEFQYNAVRVFDRVTADYSVINITDTQVSHSEENRGPLLRTAFEGMTLSHLKSFVARVNTSTEADVKNAAFIMFNGDLHNGGSPEALRPSRVAWTYNDEANAILAQLKELRVPIFLTAGNHDGYAATGQVPRIIDDMLGHAVDWLFGEEHGSLIETVQTAAPKEWPNFDWGAYARFLEATKEDAQGGRHFDIQSGAHRRLGGVKPACGSDCFRSGWLPVDRAKRNFILYDGFYQWQRTYGPTYASWTFGNTRYVNLNTYDLRQHRRTGWGMYTVNYGGGMSQVQVEWANKEVERAETDRQDVVLIGHHDPRGGHKGVDYPYYFKPIEYRGIDQSAANYVLGEVLSPKICEWVPEWAQSHEQELSCLHDGLQEWMRADTEFDCTAENRYRDARGTVEGRCDERSFSGLTHPWYSGYEMLDLVMIHPSVRTMILGHTHYNSVEVLQSGDKMVPTVITLDADAQKRNEGHELANPLRAFSSFKEHHPKEQYHPKFVTPGLSTDDDNLVVDLAQAGHAFANHALTGDKRELVVLRLTSNADLTSQRYVGAKKQNDDGDTMFGFTTLKVTARNDARGYTLPQINAVTFYMNAGTSGFEAVEHQTLDRSRKIGSAVHDKANPLCSIFRGSGANACE